MSAERPADVAGAPAIDRLDSVNDVLLRYPATARVFNLRGIDACCGGAKSLEEAAGESGVDVESLIAMLESVARRRSESDGVAHR